ncbi:SphA family protein [Mesorhizobium marinum]|uniref:SphA family protein n=1 Tax=Mesorhizobium marinum TaxID=3228790 RepID=UPI003467D2D4
MRRERQTASPANRYRLPLAWAVGSALALSVLAAAPANAAESGVGFYLLGSKGPMAGIVPPPGAYIQNDLYFYSGSAGANRDLPIGGQIVANIDAHAYINLTTGVWSTEWQVLGGNVALLGILPIGSQDVSAAVSIPNVGLGAAVDDDVFTIGDPVLGAQIGWHSGNFHWNVGALVNVPVGDYQQGEIANVAFNRWGADLSAALTWLDPDTGIDLSGAIGFTFNGENPDTDYTTGTEFHAEWALSKNFTQAFSAGLVGYYYQQVTGDSGEGANLGDFKGRVAALGATAAYNFQVGATPVSFRAKVYHEFAAENRLEGNAGYLTLSFPIGAGAN